MYPYDAYPYFTGSAGVARQRDGYILISAGADRMSMARPTISATSERSVNNRKVAR